jgi:hypothetical protein
MVVGKCVVAGMYTEMAIGPRLAVAVIGWKVIGRPVVRDMYGCPVIGPDNILRTIVYTDQEYRYNTPPVNLGGVFIYGNDCLRSMS